MHETCWGSVEFSVRFVRFIIHVASFCLFLLDFFGVKIYPSWMFPRKLRLQTRKPGKKKHGFFVKAQGTSVKTSWRRCISDAPNRKLSNFGIKVVEQQNLWKGSWFQGFHHTKRLTFSSAVRSPFAKNGMVILAKKKLQLQRSFFRQLHAFCLVRSPNLAILNDPTKQRLFFGPIKTWQISEKNPTIWENLRFFYNISIYHIPLKLESPPEFYDVDRKTSPNVLFSRILFITFHGHSCDTWLVLWFRRRF